MHRKKISPSLRIQRSIVTTKPLSTILFKISMYHYMHVQTCYCASFPTKQTFISTNLLQLLPNLWVSMECFPRLHVPKSPLCYAKTSWNSCKSNSYLFCEFVSPWLNCILEQIFVHLFPSPNISTNVFVNLVVCTKNIKSRTKSIDCSFSSTSTH